jgi:hypothetical protein
LVGAPLVPRQASRQGLQWRSTWLPCCDR